MNKEVERVIAKYERLLQERADSGTSYLSWPSSQDAARRAVYELLKTLKATQ